jgi:ABC-2 type transport system ATP-binding protein
MIEVVGLTKRYGTTVAVDDLSFTVPPGRVTGFLGPNGAGKSTTMRLILGLDASDRGSVTVNGRPYTAYRRPLLEVGALLDAKAAHPGRSAYNHLRWLALSNGIGRARVAEVLDLVGLGGVAHKRAGGFSLGMAQRLGIAAAVLGEPPVLMFDEPITGLDPEGVRWFRNLVRSLAAEGRTVFISSHLMSEMAITADRLVIIGRGRLIEQTTIEDLINSGPASFVRVRTHNREQLAKLLEAAGATVVGQPDGSLRVSGVSSDAVGELARVNALGLQELSVQHSSLEDRYVELTRESVDYHAVPPPPSTPGMGRHGNA